MLEMMVFAVTFVVANLLTVIATLAIMFNERFIKWYMKKFFKIMKDSEKMLEELEEEMEL